MLLDNEAIKNMDSPWQDYFVSNYGRVLRIGSMGFIDETYLKGGKAYVDLPNFLSQFKQQRVKDLMLVYWEEDINHTLYDLVMNTKRFRALKPKVLDTEL